MSAYFLQKLPPVLLAIILIMAVFSSCGKTAAPAPDSLNAAQSPFTSFRDIPGITSEEIAAIEALRKYKSFSYGMTLSTEAFIKEKGDGVYDSDEDGIGGYSALFCEWLGGLFGVRFEPVICGWSELIDKLNSGEIDFAGNLTPSEERLKTYLMTDPIADRQYKTIQLAGSLPLDRIALTRPLRYVFAGGSVVADTVASVTDNSTYEALFVSDYEAAYRVLERGAADAFIGDSAVALVFDSYGSIYTADFLPLIFSPVSMTTANTEFAPVISLVTKALQSGAKPWLNHLYNEGYESYKKNKFFTQLSDDEKAYLRNTDFVPLAARYFNYPVDFYNAYEKKWEGIVFDVLAGVEELTGLKFKVANTTTTELSDLFNMVYDGRAHIMPELIYSERRAQYVIWTKHIFLTDQLALLSRSSYPNVSVNEIPYKRVGVIANTVRAEMFRRWFPSTAHITDYTTDEIAMRALEQGEVDLVMSSKNRLLSFLNFQEISLFKANFLFNYPYESTFGFHKDQTVLCSIMDKALPLVDTYMITEQWLTKTYDYRMKLMEAQRPWLIGATVLSLAVLALILVLFFRNRNEGKRLEKIVTKQTATIKSESIKFKEKAHWYESILDAIPLPVSVTDPNRNWTFVNLATYNFLGVNRDDIIGKPCSSWGAGIGNTADCGIECVLREMKQTRFYHGGSSYQVVVEILKGMDGETIGYIEVVQDVTKLENTAKQEAEAISQAKSVFLANMSHEMRTPMNVIVGFTDLMLEEDDVPDKLKETLRKINTAGHTLMGLINDVLDISKIEAGKLELIPVQYDVASLLNDVITLNLIRIQNKPITFKLNIEGVMPAILFGDDLRIKQILNNLISNAFKYTKNGSVTLNVSVGSDGPIKDGDHVFLSFAVSDTGIGIREEDISKLFSDYNQLDTRANRAIEGTGLGLSITKKFIEMMDGEISVESEYGKGTTFYAKIRQGFVTNRVMGKETVESLCDLHYSDKKRQTQKKLSRPDLSYVRVLVVDDFPTNLDVAAGMLRKYKMQVDCVQSGQEAVNLVAAGERVYDAVFMDHMMPGMDGVQATKAIRALETEYAHNVPVIALTANVVAGNEQMFLNNGFNAFLPKPFNVMGLDSVIQLWVRDKSRE
jgi:signal transduction histidine kinase/ABC-type amino acid transport substrate-binding protein